MGKSDRKPKASQTPAGKSSRTANNPGRSSPRIGNLDPDGTNDQTPVWSLAVFDHQGPWGRERCSKDDSLWKEIYPKLRNYETMTWGEIERNKKRDHSVPVEGIVKEALERLAELKLDDIDDLFRFRLSGKMRVWGIRIGRVFQLLWWDPEHEIWPVEHG